MRTIDYGLELKNTLAQYPRLSHHGLGSKAYDRRLAAHGPSPDPIHPGSDDIDMFRMCYLWLSRIPKNWIVQKDSPNTYELKHMADPEIGYSTNGIFIAAAIATGFVIRINDGPNPTLNISKSMADALREISETIDKSGISCLTNPYQHDTDMG